MENTEAQRKKGLWVEHPHRRNKNAGFSIPKKWYICFLWGRGHFIFSESCYNCCLLTLSGSRFLSKASIKFHPNLKDKTKKNEQYYSSVSFLWRFSGHLIQWCVHAQSLSCVWLFVSSWTVAHQATLSMEFSKQEYSSRLPCPPPGDLPDPGIEPASSVSPVLQADPLPLSHQGSPIQ